MWMFDCRGSVPLTSELFKDQLYCPPSWGLTELRGSFPGYHSLCCGNVLLQDFIISGRTYVCMCCFVLPWLMCGFYKSTLFHRVESSQEFCRVPRCSGAQLKGFHDFKFSSGTL